MTSDPREERAPDRYSDADYPLQALTGRIISAFHHVHYTHGFGFLESVYRRALAIELRHRGVEVKQLVRYELVHRGLPIGLYEADLIAEASVILEVKTGLVLDPVAPVQLLNYLRASDLRVGLVLHFGPRPQIRRVISSGRFSRLASAHGVDAEPIGSVTGRNSAIGHPNELPDYDR